MRSTVFTPKEQTRAEYPLLVNQYKMVGSPVLMLVGGIFAYLSYFFYRRHFPTGPPFL